MKRNVLLLLSSFFVSIAQGQTQFSITKTNPSTNSSIPSDQVVQIEMNAVPSASAQENALFAFGRYSGSYRYEGAASISKNILSWTPRSVYMPNEHIQLSATARIMNEQGLPISNPKVYNYRVQTSKAGEGVLVDSTTVSTKGTGLGSLFQLADMNNDGWIDIVDFDSQGALSYYYNSAGYFNPSTPVEVATAPIFMHVADLYNDGFPDVVFATGKNRALYIVENDGGQLSTTSRALALENFPAFGFQDDYVPISGDVDADGDLDLVVGQGSMCVVFVNEPLKKAFTVTTIKVDGTTGNSLALVDVDNDGDLDILTQAGSVSHNDGRGNFETLTNTAGSIISSEELDFDNDGDIDLAQLLDNGKALQIQLLANESGSFKLYKTLNVAKTSSVATSLYSGDYNGDGWLDLGFFVEEPPYDNKFQFLYNDGKGNYSGVTKHAVKRLNNFSGTADLDGDGDLDFVGLVNEAALGEKYYNIYKNGIRCDNPFLVTSTEDNSDVLSCGMLRFAIQQANKLPGRDVIQIDLPKGSVITLETSLSLYEPVVIQGTGSDNLTITGKSTTTIFNVYGASAAQSNNARLEAAGDTTVIRGATLAKVANAIYYIDRGTLMLRDCKIRDNSNEYGVAGLYFSGLNLSIDSCIFSSNRAPYNPQGIVYQGVAAYIGPNGGKVHINRTTFSDNYGGAPDNLNRNGNAIHFSGSTYTALIENSTFSANQSFSGGAIYYRGSGQDSVAIVNSTFSGNIALQGGGAIYTQENARLSLTNVTITGNGKDSVARKDDNGTIQYITPQGGGLYLLQGRVHLTNTIMANNNAHDTSGTDIVNNKANIISHGGNLIGVLGGSFNPLTSDQVGSNRKPLDPKLGPLAINGGLTRTHFPLAGSPIIDKGIKNSLKTDQRGEARVFGTSIDVGAVEYTSTPIVFAGKDSTTCTNKVTLYALAIPTSQTGYKGFWRNLDTKVKGTFSDSTTYNSIANLAYGLNQFAWTITDGGKFTQSDTVKITSYYLAQKALLGLDRTIFTDTTTLVGNSPSSVATSTIRWRVMSGGSTLKDSTKSSTWVSKLAQGLNQFSYRFGTAPCVSRDTIRITYVHLDSANAGTNITACSDTARLNAKVPAKGYSGKWTILKGSSLKLAVDTMYNSRISGIKDSASTLVWTVTHATTKKTTADTLTIFGIFVKAKITKPDTLDKVFVTNRTISLDAQVSGQLSATWFLNKVALGTAIKTTATITKDTNVFVLRAVNGRCAAWDSVYVYFRDSTRAFAGPDFVVCSDSAVLSALKPAIGYAGKWRVLNKVTVVTVARDTLFNSIARNLGKGRAADTLEWSVQRGRFVTRDTVVIRQQVRPFVSVLSADSYCANVDSISISGAVRNATGGRWSGGLHFASADSIGTYYLPTDAERAQGSAFLILTSTGNGKCAAAKDTMRIDFMEVPQWSLARDTAFRACTGRGNLIESDSISAIFNKGLAYEWETLDRSPNSLSSYVFRKDSSKFEIDSLYNFRTRFRITVSKNDCSTSDTLAYYYLKTINVKEDSVPVKAGNPVTWPVIDNDAYNMDIEKLELLDSLGRGTTSLIKSAKISPDKRSIIFETNAQYVQSDRSTTYRVSNSCGVIAIGRVVVIGTGTPPNKITETKVVKTGKVITTTFTMAQLDVNLDVNVDSMKVNPPASGAKASFSYDSSSNVFTFRIDYTDVPNFEGNDFVRFTIKDKTGQMNYLDFNLTLEPESEAKVTVYQALSPNGDGKHDVVEIDNIEAYPNNTFRVFNRWGDRVYHADGYNGTTKTFDGKDLPDGTYFYVLELGDGSKALEGYIVLKR